MDKIIYITNVTTSLEFHNIMKILEKYFGYEYANNVGTTEYPLNILYLVDDKIAKFEHGVSRVNLKLFQIVRNHSADEFISTYVKLGFKKYKHPDLSSSGFMMPMGEPKPKFKVGDRVKIDWGQYHMPRFQEAKIEDICDSHFCPSDNIFRYDVTIIDGGRGYKVSEDMLALVESKPKCKFKANDVVIANIFGKYTKCVIYSYDTTKDRITYDVYVYGDEHKLLHTFYENQLAETKVTLNDLNKESKPKWSVGTYVEIVEELRGVDQLYADCGIYKIIRNSTNGIAILVGNDNVYLTQQYVYKKEQLGLIKWHENKPEKKYPDATNAITKEHIQEDLEEERNIICGSGFWKHLEHAASKFDYDSSHYPTGEFDMATLDDVNKYMTSQGVKPPYYIYPERLAGYFKFGYDILSKPQITISKQKKINININKPKI